MVTRARYVHRVPEGVTLAQAALTGPLAVVHKGLRRLGSSANDGVPRRCAVLGAGTIGHLTALVLKLRGHDVTVFDLDAGRLAAFDGRVPTSTSLARLEDFEWLIEATGKHKVLEAALQQSASGAALLLLGFPYAEHSFNFSFESLLACDRAIIGSVGSSRRDFLEALRVLPLLDTTAFLRTSFPLSDFEKAFAAARSRSSLKVMLTADEMQASGIASLAAS
jgi:threonine dehydrogenase-like Zn-dependent dehydrogenase